MMMKYFLFLLILTYTTSTFADDGGLELRSGWQAEIIAECADEMPDMLLLSSDKKSLYQSCETRENMMAPSLARINLATGKREILIYGLGRADGMRFAPDGAIWLGEEQADGMVWRIENPDQLQAGQRADRHRLLSSSKQIQAKPEAGTFSHEGLAFSADGRFLYLADEWKEGALYRLNIQSKVLKVFHAKKGWLHIKRREDARVEAERLHASRFNRLEDMQRMPDGSILVTETGTGKILQIIDDANTAPIVTVLLQHPQIEHPDNLEWDVKRNWLWISDDSNPSELWAWDGKEYNRIAYHTSAEITGIESGPDGSIYFNLQHRRFAPDLTMRIFQQK
ncbi:MAG: hypothetical protein R8M38_09750 [Mariprofundaceae bacterium]